MEFFTFICTSLKLNFLRKPGGTPSSPSCLHFRHHHLPAASSTAIYITDTDYSRHPAKLHPHFPIGSKINVSHFLFFFAIASCKMSSCLLLPFFVFLLYDFLLYYFTSLWHLPYVRHPQNLDSFVFLLHIYLKIFMFL